MLTLGRIMAKKKKHNPEPLPFETTTKVSGEVGQLIKELVALTRAGSSREYFEIYVRDGLEKHREELMEARRVK